MKYYRISNGQLSKLLTGWNKLYRASTDAIKAAPKPSKDTFWNEGYRRAIDQAKDDLMGLRLTEIALPEPKRQNERSAGGNFS